MHRNLSKRMFTFQSPMSFLAYSSGPEGIFDITELPWMIRTPGQLVKSQLLFLGTHVTKRPT